MKIKMTDLPKWHKEFTKKYKDVNTIIYNNYENINEIQKERFTTDLKNILENITEYNTIYRSDYQTLLIMLKDLQFYEFMRRGKNYDE